MSESELRQCCTEIFGNLNVTEEEAKFLESSTKAQSNSTIWHQYRKGRITASYFCDVSKYTWEKYPLSLVKSIMQYYAVSENVPALKWGKEHEDDARKEYILYMESRHTHFEVKSSGLVINPSYPYLGASPDGVVSCDCCGTGVLEIKCTYKYRNEVPTCDDALCDRSYFLKEFETGTIRLSPLHKYYYQVQAQMSICNTSYCDFVCWTTKGIFVERLTKDENFVTSKLPRFKRFFCEYLLPEILTRKLESEEFPTGSDVLYCICRKPEAGRMVACDNENCTIQWFHFKCVGLKRAPVGNWYCTYCACK